MLEHPWFNDLRVGDESDDVPILKSVAANLKEQKRMSTRAQFRAGVGAIMAVHKTQRLLNIKHGRAPT